ncbi:MAG TPA: DUF2141 domain-containing protein [Bacteroidales bacterium]|nr:DUF2141 domain-containing protein [Bacteroidales bacterium]
MNCILLIFYTLVIHCGVNTNDSIQKQPGKGLTVKIKDVRNHQGLVRIGFYYDRKEFTDNPSGSYAFRKDTLSSNALVFTLKGIPAGTYAISVLDDEDEDNKMDYRMVIWPDEGFGFSNNPMINRPVKPKYDDISFDYNGGDMIVEIVIVYF